MTVLLVFLTLDAADDRWLRLAGDVVAARGAGLPPADDGDSATIAVLPGDAVMLHWVDLPALAPAQALAAARLLAADVSAAPLADTHVAVADGAGARPLALVDAGLMAGWVARLAAAGVVADHIVPLPLLLPLLPGVVAVLEWGGLWQVRGDTLAFAAEPALAALLLEGRETRTISVADFESGLAAALAALPIDLRQGDFAAAPRWRLEARRLRRLAVMAAALLVVLVATDLAALLRTGLAADRAEQKMGEAARAALPRGTIITDPQGQMSAELERRGDGRRGFAGLAAPLLAVLRDRPGAALRSLRYTPNGGLVAEITLPARDDRRALVAALAAAGLVATFDDAGATLTVRRP